MLPYPKPLGDMAGLDMEDRADAAERAARPNYGRGLYETEHEQTDAASYRRGQFIAFAWGMSRIDALIMGSIPDRTLEFVAEWEYTLGIPNPPKTWTIEQRWQRIRARAIEPRGSDAENIEDALIAAVGYDAFIINNPYVGDAMSFRVRIFTPIIPGSAEWQVVKDVLWRMKPAHVRCYVDWPDLGLADDLLGDGWAA
jgi:hypothetical protein